MLRQLCRGMGVDHNQERATRNCAYPDLADHQAVAGSILDEWSLALIGNASGQTVGVERGLEPRRFR